MKLAEVEIYSDAPNTVVMRHPGRKFPGSLIQGDSLYALCCMADEACQKARSTGAEEALISLNELRNSLWDRLNHYSQVLEENNIPLPFSRAS